MRSKPMYLATRSSSSCRTIGEKAVLRKIDTFTHRYRVSPIRIIDRLEMVDYTVESPTPKSKRSLRVCGCGWVGAGETRTQK